MKQILIGLNVIFGLAIAFLFYKVYSKDGGTSSKAKAVSTSSTLAGTAPAGGFNIAYIELDSINNKVDFVKNNRFKLEAEQRSIENEIEAAYRNLENRKNEFLKKGNSITQQEAEAMQNQLMEGERAAGQRKQQRTEKLSKDSYNFMDDVQGKLEAFIKEYNADGRYRYVMTVGSGVDILLYKDSTLNITNDVVKGMNEKYPAKN